MSGATAKGENKRRHIMETAIRIFARKGYSATGMREIAQEAGVNLAMINYYFDSKANLLKTIMEDFLDKFKAVTDDSLKRDFTPENFEEFIRSYVKDLTLLCREHTDLMKVTFSELPSEIPEIAELKGRFVKNIIGELLTDRMASMLKKHSDLPFMPLISGPALGGMIVMHFLLRPIMESIFGLKLENDFYESFPDYISNIFLFGTIGNKNVAFAIERVCRA